MTAVPKHADAPVAVMLCDGSTPAGKALSSTVAAAGFVIRATTTRPTELLELVQPCQPEVVVVDLALAGPAGTRLLTALRSLVPHCPVVAAAALAGMDRRSVSGSVAVVVDPSDLRPLARALRNVAGHHTDLPS